MAKPIRIGPRNRGPFEGAPTTNFLSPPICAWVTNANAPQIADMKAAAGYALIFAAALASGSGDALRLTWGHSQANLYDQASARAVFPSTRLGATKTVPPFLSARPEDEVRPPPQFFKAATAPLTLRSGAIFYVVPPQTEERLAAQFYRPALAAGSMGDEKLAWSGQSAWLFDQSVTRAVYAPNVTPTVVYTIRPILAAGPQLIDLTPPNQLWTPGSLRQGPVPAAILIMQQAYTDSPSQVRVPQPAPQGNVPAPILIAQQSYVDVPSVIRVPNPAAQGRVPATIQIPQQAYTDPPSSVETPSFNAQGKVPATIRIPQQEYRDSWATLRAPQPASQGAVPATIAIPPQVYSDLSALLARPTPASQGAVPQLFRAPPQDDPTQRDPVIWRSATATVIIPNPIGGFFFVPSQFEERPTTIVWTGQRAGSKPLVPAMQLVLPQYEDRVSLPIVWPSTRIGTTPRVPPMQIVPPQADTTQLAAQFYGPAIGRSLPFPMVWASPQFIELGGSFINPSVRTPAALLPTYIAISPQQDVGINYSAVFTLKTFVTPGGQPFRAWVGIGRSSSTTGESGNVG